MPFGKPNAAYLQDIWKATSPINNLRANARVQLRGRRVGAVDDRGALRAHVSCNDSLASCSADAGLRSADDRRDVQGYEDNEVC
jgi:hypothetical protein